MTESEKVKAAREYAEHHGVKDWTEHIFNVLDALDAAQTAEVTDDMVKRATAAIQAKYFVHDRDARNYARAALVAVLTPSP